MDLDEFTDYVNEVLDVEIPPVLLEGLNLGVIVQPQLERSKDKSVAAWKKRILRTVKHELTHHIEALAGQNDLANKEIYEKYLRQQRKKKGTLQ